MRDLDSPSGESASSYELNAMLGCPKRSEAGDDALGS